MLFRSRAEQGETRRAGKRAGQCKGRARIGRGAVARVSRGAGGGALASCACILYVFTRLFFAALNLITLRALKALKALKTLKNGLTLGSRIRQQPRFSARSERICGELDALQASFSVSQAAAACCVYKHSWFSYFRCDDATCGRLVRLEIGRAHV